MILGISGKFLSGKDTFYSILQHHSMQDVLWEERKFADSLKHVCKTITNDSEQWTQAGKARENCLGITNGRLQQLVGEGLRQTVDPLIWTKILFNEYVQQDMWVITDLRYKNEAEYLRSLQTEVKLIRINPSYENWEDLVEQSGRDRFHKSEIDLDHYENFDYIIDNNTTVSEYIEKVKDCILTLGL